MTEPTEVCEEKPKEGSINRGNLRNRNYDKNSKLEYFNCKIFLMIKED